MTVKWEKLEPNVGLLEVEVEEGKVATALDRAFRKVAARVNVPGFRKGKVPRKIFEARFGVESLYQDALDDLLPTEYSKAIGETDLEPVDRPSIDIVQMEAGKPLVFKATVTLKPEVTLGAYKGLSFEDKSFAVSEEQLAAELENVRAGHAELRVLEEGTAEKGDLLVIDFEGFVDGEPFEGGEAENYQLELGSGTFVPGFEDQLIGITAGEDKEIVITFPDDYHVKSLQGKEAKFQVHVHDMKRKFLPELDDEFVKDISEHETLADYTEELRKSLEHRAEHEHEHFVQDTLVKLVVDAATVDIPAVMIEQEIDGQMRSFESRLQQQGIPLDAYQEFTGATTEELRNQYRESAAESVKTSLVLEAIAKAEEIQVSEEEVDLELQKVADSAGLDFARVKEIFGTRDPGFSGIRAEIQVRKTVQFLVEHSAKA